MAHRSGWMFLGASALTGLLAVWSTLAGCRSDDTSGSSQNAGGSGGSGTGTTVGSTTSSTSASSTTASSSSGGGEKVVTIKDVTTGVVGPKTHVKLAGVVAMSQKFFVSKGSTSGSCLWGVFVSAPGLTETGPNTGTLVLSYGTKAAIPDGGSTAACPRLGIDPIGDNIPDDIKPGDVVDAVGDTDYFLLTQCATQPNGSKVNEFQVAQAVVTKTGMTAPLPAPHVLTADEITKLVSQNDKAFYDQWGGVKVRLQNVTSVPQMVTDADAGMVASIVDKFGHMVLAGSNLQVGDKIYFQSSTADPKIYCHKAPVYPPTTTFTSVDGILYLDFCTWSVQPNDKCADIAPPSADAADCNNSPTACAK